MKKILIICSVLLVSFCLFAAQETYRADSYEVRAFKALKRLAGSNTVEPTYPISGSQLLILMKELNVSRLSGDALKMYNEIVDKLQNRFEYADWTNGNVAIEARVNINPQIYIRTGKEKISYDELYLKIPDRSSLIELGGSIWIGDWFAGRCDASFRKRFTQDNWSKNFSFNAFGSQIEEHHPYEAWVSLGKKAFNFLLARDRLSSGTGVSGNVLVSDNFMWNDFVKLGVASDVISYDFTIMSFDREGKGTEEEVVPNKLYPLDFNSPNAIIGVHRFSLRAFKILTLSISELNLQYCTNVLQSVSILNPFMVFHNTSSYASGNNNNAFGAEISANLTHGFEISANFMFDQLQSKQEIEAYGKEKIPPNAWTGLINLVKTFSMKKGFLDTYIEGVYVSPACYLKEDNPRDSDYRWWQTDFCLGNRLSDVDYFQNLGYPLGPDTIAIGTGANYEHSKLRVKFDILYSLRGTYRRGDKINTDWEYFYATTPLCIGSGKVPEHGVRTGVSVNYKIFEGLELNASTAYIGYINYNNNKDKKFSDVQLSIGAKIKTIGIIKHFLKKDKKV